MQIVIDIPEEIKNTIECGVINNEMIYKVCDAIKDGTPLPEIHGRLIDADALKVSEYEIIVDRQYINEFFPDEPVYNYIPYYKCDTIKNAPTIIKENK